MLTIGEKRVMDTAWTKIRKMEFAIEDETLEDDGTLKAMKDLYKLANNLAGKVRDLETRLSHVKTQARMGVFR